MCVNQLEIGVKAGVFLEQSVLKPLVAFGEVLGIFANICASNFLIKLHSVLSSGNFTQLWPSAFRAMVKRFCRKGIPSEFRSYVWMTLSGADKEMKENPNVYKSASGLQPAKEFNTTILADLPRTFPENANFSDAAGRQNKRHSLQRVLQAFAITFPKIGYCQGLNYVAATILLVLDGPPEEIEEKTFWLLHALTHNIVPAYYISGMVDVQVDCLVFEELLRQKVPSVYKVLKEANVDCIVLATKWFICLFADVVPMETVLRIFDSLFYEGDKILFRACIALVKLHLDDIVKCHLFPDVVLTFRNICKDKQTLYCHEFLQAMFKLTGSLPRSRIQRLREKCRVTVMQTMDDLNQRETEYRARLELEQQQQQQNQHHQQHQQQPGVGDPEMGKATSEEVRTEEEGNEEGGEGVTGDLSKTTCNSNGDLGPAPSLVRSTVG
ncbi:Growth hormone-regulated TBC protein 1 [Sparganum proliferum]